MAKHCCETMAYHVSQECDQHPDPFDCPDHLIHYSSPKGTYGLIIHDGGTSFVSIHFCPWCGTALPSDEPPAGKA